MAPVRSETIYGRFVPVFLQRVLVAGPWRRCNVSLPQRTQLEPPRGVRYLRALRQKTNAKESETEHPDQPTTAIEARQQIQVYPEDAVTRSERQQIRVRST